LDSTLEFYPLRLVQYCIPNLAFGLVEKILNIPGIIWHLGIRANLDYSLVVKGNLVLEPNLGPKNFPCGNSGVRNIYQKFLGQWVPIRGSLSENPGLAGTY